MGGIENTRGGGRHIRPCPHSESIVTTTAGLERTVCEKCGHVSVHYLTEISGDVDRDRFARPADELQVRKLRAT